MAAFCSKCLLCSLCFLLFNLPLLTFENTEVIVRLILNMRYRLRTLLIVLGLAPPVLAGVMLLLMSPSTRPMMANFITFAVGIAAATWPWIRWPTLVDSVFKR